MRFYDIVLFLIILQLVSAWFVAVAPSMGFTESIGFHEPTEEELTEAQRKFEEATLESEEVASEDWVTKLLGFVSESIKSAVSTIMTPFKKYVLSLPYMLIMLGPKNSPQWEAFVWLISTPLYVIEIIGIVQLITGRSFKEIE